MPPTPLERAVGLFAIIFVVVYFRKELASELRLLKQDISQWLKKATKKSP